MGHTKRRNSVAVSIRRWTLETAI